MSHTQLSARSGYREDSQWSMSGSLWPEDEGITLRGLWYLREKEYRESTPGEPHQRAKILEWEIRANEARNRLIRRSEARKYEWVGATAPANTRENGIPESEGYCHLLTSDRGGTEALSACSEYYSYWLAWFWYEREDGKWYDGDSTIKYLQEF
jgi:hypothetical protein